MRCKATLSYNGADFYGSQSQKVQKPTINKTIEEALAKLNISSKIVASGRTDRGVHALNQVCHFELPHFWNNLDKLKNRLNIILPPSILIKKLEPISDDFHARYSAKRRVYRYIFKKTPPSPFEEKFITYVKDLQYKKIKNNISLFIGEHNFANFLKNGSGEKSTIREIFRAFAYEHKGYFVLYFEANGFLRSQIRLMTQALLTLEKDEIIDMLELKSKKKLSLAPPNGLYLHKIKYNI